MNPTPTKKRLQVIFSEEAWTTVDALTREANQNFEVGTITYSDVVNELVMSGKLDIKALQAKRTDVKRSLRYLASQDSIDIDSVIKTLTELKSKTGRKSSKTIQSIEEASR